MTTTAMRRFAWTVVLVYMAAALYGLAVLPLESRWNLALAIGGLVVSALIVVAASVCSAEDDPYEPRPVPEPARASIAEWTVDELEELWRAA